MFFSELGHVARLGRKVSAAAFSKARDKLSFRAFEEIYKELTGAYYNEFNFGRSFGLRVLAIDGSVFTLPRNESTIREFGDNVLSDNGKWIKAQVSIMCDVVNSVCVRGEIGPYRESESSQAKKLMTAAGSGDLLLFDRGYFGREFLWETYKTGAKFCFRVQVNACSEVQGFIANGDSDRGVCISTPKGKVPARITRITLDTGEHEYLVTNLFARHIYSRSVLGKIYHMRWGAEECYKDMKHAICMENFAGKKPNSIKQEFYANIITYNMAMMGFASAIRRKANKGKKKHKYKTNKRALLAKVKQCFTQLFCYGGQKAQIVKDIIDTVAKEAVPIRNGRKVDRQKTTKAKRKTVRAYIPAV